MIILKKNKNSSRTLLFCVILLMFLQLSSILTFVVTEYKAPCLLKAYFYRFITELIKSFNSNVIAGAFNKKIF